MVRQEGDLPPARMPRRLEEGLLAAAGFLYNTSINLATGALCAFPLGMGVIVLLGTIMQDNEYLTGILFGYLMLYPISVGLLVLAVIPVSVYFLTESLYTRRYHIAIGMPRSIL